MKNRTEPGDLRTARKTTLAEEMVREMENILTSGWVRFKKRLAAM